MMPEPQTMHCLPEKPFCTHIEHSWRHLRIHLKRGRNTCSLTDSNLNRPDCITAATRHVCSTGVTHFILDRNFLSPFLYVATSTYSYNPTAASPGKLSENCRKSLTEVHRENKEKIHFYYTIVLNAIILMAVNTLHDELWLLYQNNCIFCILTCQTSELIKAQSLSGHLVPNSNYIWGQCCHALLHSSVCHVYASASCCYDNYSKL